jgi:hypothetical protein
LTVAVSVALVLGRFAVARRLVPLGLREAHNANTAVMFGALYVIDVRPDRRLLDLLRRLSVRHSSAEVCAGRGRERGGDPPLGGSFPGTERREVQDLAESYARTVLDEGCP